MTPEDQHKLAAIELHERAVADMLAAKTVFQAAERVFETALLQFQTDMSASSRKYKEGCEMDALASPNEDPTQPGVPIPNRRSRRDSEPPPPPSPTGMKRSPRPPEERFFGVQEDRGPPRELVRTPMSSVIPLEHRKPK